MTTKKILADFFNTTFKPRLAETQTGLNFNKWKGVIILFLFGEIASILGVLPKALLEEYDLIVDLDNILSRYQDTWPQWRLLLVGGLLAPAIEELTWRLHLKFSLLNWSLSLGGVAYYISGLVLDPNAITDLLSNFEIRLFISVSIIGISVVTLNSWNILLRRIEKFWAYNFKWIYWLMIITFALMHINRYQNFGNDPLHYLIVPLIILPQLISGSIFGYLRMRYGFIYCLIFHIVGNTYLQLIF